MNQKNDKKTTGAASFSIVNCESGCNNCGKKNTFGVVYKPVFNKEKELVLCHECSVGLVTCLYNAGMLE